MGAAAARSGRTLGTAGAAAPVAARDSDGCDAVRRSGCARHRHAGRPQVGRSGNHPTPEGGESVSSTKYIFVTGGVVSSLGKGIAAASLGRLLAERGLKVTIQKFDPYINVDPGTMSPFQHGEVYVTDDGAETAELKTKPTQHSVRELMQIGIQPDILVCRTERQLSEDLKRKIAQFCNVDFGCVVESPDVKSIYEIPLKLHEQGLDKEVCTRLHLDTKEPDLRAWAVMVDKILKSPHHVGIAVVGKYTELADSYKSIHEPLVHR